MDRWIELQSVCVLSAGKPLFPGTSTMNQIERIMSVLPQPSRQEIQTVGSPYALAILGQIPRRSAKLELRTPLLTGHIFPPQVYTTLACVSTSEMRITFFLCLD